MEQIAPKINDRISAAQRHVRRRQRPGTRTGWQRLLFGVYDAPRREPVRTIDDPEPQPQTWLAAQPAVDDDDYLYAEHDASLVERARKLGAV